MTSSQTPNSNKVKKEKAEQSTAPLDIANHPKPWLFKEESEKYRPISIRLHPRVFEWAKAEAERRGIGYQKLINETLLQHTNS